VTNMAVTGSGRRVMGVSHGGGESDDDRQPGGDGSSTTHRPPVRRSDQRHVDWTTRMTVMGDG